MIIKIGNNQEFETNVNRKRDKNQAFRYAKTSLKRKYNIYPDQEAIDLFIKEKYNCVFCGNLAKVIFDIEYDENNNILYINNAYHKICDGMIKRYCANKCPNNNLNTNSKEFVSKVFNLTYKEANEYILNRSNSPFYKNNFNSEEEYKKYQRRDKDFYINKYGNEEGERKFNKIKNTISKKNSKDGLIEMYGEEKADEINKKKGITINNLIQKYGEEEGIKRYYNWIEGVKNNLKNFIERYGEENGRKKYEEYCNNSGSDLNNFIRVHGESAGKQKFKEYVDKMKHSLSLEGFKERYGKIEGEEKYKNFKIKRPQNSYSQESIDHFNYFIKNIGLKIKNIKWKTYEKPVWDNNFKRVFFYDFYFEYGDKRIIIEYDTPAFHPNKNEMTNEEFNSWEPIYSNETPLEKYKKDEYKKDLARKYNIWVYTLYNKEGSFNKRIVDDLINKIKKDIYDKS